MINVLVGVCVWFLGIVVFVMLLVFIMFGVGLVEKFFMVVLIGLMIMVFIGIFEWVSLKIFNKMLFLDIFVMVLVMGIIVVLYNLVLVVFIGVIIVVLVFVWDNVKCICVCKCIDEDGVKYYEIYGLFFFGLVVVFNEKFDVLNDLDEVIIDFEESWVVDMLVIEVFNKIIECYCKVGKKVYFYYLSFDCCKLLKNVEEIIDVNVLEDFIY